MFSWTAEVPTIDHEAADRAWQSLLAADEVRRAARHYEAMVLPAEVPSGE